MKEVETGWAYNTHGTEMHLKKKNPKGKEI
jgi:hypothetical protein